MISRGEFIAEAIVAHVKAVLHLNAKMQMHRFFRKNNIHYKNCNKEDISIKEMFFICQDFSLRLCYHLREDRIINNKH